MTRVYVICLFCFFNMCHAMASLLAERVVCRCRASYLQEKIFRDEKKRLGRDIDVFVVNSTGSAFQVGH